MMSGIWLLVSSMIVIEDNGKLEFFDGKKKLTSREGFGRLAERYKTEPAETRKIIDRLRDKYGRS